MDRYGDQGVKEHRFPDSRTFVQMLDDRFMNNKFYCKLRGNCEETDQRFAMAPELHDAVRISVSDARQYGLSELAIT
jgi:hypothetical protein